MIDRKATHKVRSTTCTEPANPSGLRRREILLCLLLCIITLGIYWQTGNHDFINLDDNLYVTENVYVQKGLTWESISWAFTALHDGNWFPLTWLSHMADFELFGLNPRGHHLTSIIIHTASAVLLFLFLVSCTERLWRSFFVAALFALHPLHVESAAWIAERKDVLCGFFWMLTLIAYSRYVKRPLPGRYLQTFFFCIMALMAKPMAVTLPLVLFLMDYWPCALIHQEIQPGGFRNSLTGWAPLSRLLKEKIPFLFLSLFSGAITLYAQQKWSYVIGLDLLPFGLRVENALVAYTSYIGKMFWPVDMAIIYPYSRTLPLWHVGVSLLLLSVVSLTAFQARKRFPYLLIGWLWFVMTLVPVIGLIQVGSQSMADRYTYLPLIGLFIMATWGVSDLMQGRRCGKGLLALSATMVLLVLSVVTYRQTSFWRNSGSIFEHALEAGTGNYMVQNNLGIAHNNLGMFLRRQGRNQEALFHFLRAVEISPNYATAHFNLGVTFTALGNRAAAIRHLETALRINPKDEEARQYLEFLVGAGH